MSVEGLYSAPEGFQMPAGDRFVLSPDGVGAGLVQGTEGNAARFFDKEYKLEKVSKEAKLPLHTTKTYIEIKCAFDPKNVHVHPVTKSEEDVYKMQYPREWQLYLKQKEYSAKGTPLIGWNEVSPAERANLEAYGIVTLEKLVESDAKEINPLVNGRAIELIELAIGQLNYKQRIAEVGKVTKELISAKGELENSYELIEKLTQEKKVLQETVKRAGLGNTPYAKSERQKNVMKKRALAKQMIVEAVTEAKEQEEQTKEDITE